MRAPKSPTVRSSARHIPAHAAAWLIAVALPSAALTPACSPAARPEEPATPASAAGSEGAAAGEASAPAGGEQALPAGEAPSAESSAPPGSDVGAAEAGGEAGSAEQMLDFFEVGRGDRVADLGGVSGYTLLPIRKAVGRAGVVYVRRQPPPPPDAEQEADDAAAIVWMDTPDEAPLIPEAKRLNVVTLLFAYHSVIAAGHDRKKLNAAVFRALEPGGTYIVADHAAPPGSGLGAALAQNRVEEAIVRAEVQAAGFVFVEAADFISGRAKLAERSPTSQYVLKFRKPK